MAMAVWSVWSVWRRATFLIFASGRDGEWGEAERAVERHGGGGRRRGGVCCLSLGRRTTDDGNMLGRR
jgi:hypothetical protein